MSSDQTFSTNDLRSHAVDYQRAKEKKTKWAYGQAWGPGRDDEDLAHARPLRPYTDSSSGNRRDDGRSISSFKHQARQSRKADVHLTADHYPSSSSGDSSAEEDVVEASAAPAPDADITYSFDAAKGPGHGSQILGLALAKAIERYEVRVTDKLIQDEYEVLGSDGEAAAAVAAGRSRRRKLHDGAASTSSAGGSKAGAGAEEDDYEFV